MKISKLLKGYIGDIVNNHIINKLSRNSKEVIDNDVFIAINDGHKYINEAIKNGAKTIIHEREVDRIEGINYFIVDDTQRTLGVLANKMFNEITKKVKLIGVTGTNGKTTISVLLYNFFEYQNMKCLLLGTNGIQYKDSIYENKNTTPDILVTLEYIKTAYDKGVRCVIMEVSSQAIDNLRVFNFDFDVAIFTNLTHDHLDYHKNMLLYRDCKGLFIHSVENKKKNLIVLNKDDEYYKYFLRVSRSKVVTYGLTNNADYKAINIKKTLDRGTSFKVITSKNKYSFKTFLMGEFNIYNILACLSVVNHFGFKTELFMNFLKYYVTVSGRMEMLKIGNRTFIVDYAHTPDGVKNVLSSIKEYSKNRLICVIGCGGNRDKTKRPVIGSLVTSMADYVIFTNDNPRFEDENEIIKDILQTVVKDNYECITNRRSAIKRAIDISKNNDIIAVLGKGCEKRQIINNIKYPFDDKEIIKELMKEEVN